MSSREYAENLIGGWDRSGYAKQGDVAKQTAKTKWEVLQNQFANLKAQLESQREEAQQNFSEGLGAVAEGSYDRMNKGTADLVNRGLTNSGIGNLITQADTRAKGADVRGLLDTLGNVMTQNADKLKQGGDQLHQQGMANNQNLGETLGALGNRDMESQMAYNKGAANIAEAKEVRDANNRLQAMQRARSGGGGGGSSKSKEESDAEDFYKKLAINEIIADETMTRQQKSNLLKIGFDVADPDTLLGDRGTFKAPTPTKSAYDSFKDLYKDGGWLGREISNPKPMPTNYKEFYNQGGLMGMSGQLLGPVGGWLNKVDREIADYTIKQKAENEANKLPAPTRKRPKDPTQTAIEDWLNQFSSVKR